MIFYKFAAPNMLGDEHGNMRQQGKADSRELTAKSC
jgi:hypothetical protein